jgi:ABC-type multidrug transport system permease subunit
MDGPQPRPAPTALDPLAHLWATIRATAWRYVKTRYAYPIELLPWALTAFVSFAIWRITYAASGRDAVEGTSASAYLMIGLIGLGTWTSTIWSSGYTLEYERSEGTIGALFLAPASRAAVIAGYGLGSILWLAPSFIGILLLGLLTGARFAIHDPLAPLLALATTVLVSLATGFAFAGIFILSRRANALANFLQPPIYLLAGFLVPRDELPDPLYAISNAIPAGHAVEALRASALRGASLPEIAPALLAALGVATVYALIGFLTLRKVEYAAKRIGDLDLY